MVNVIYYLLEGSPNIANLQKDKFPVQRKPLFI